MSTMEGRLFETRLLMCLMLDSIKGRDSKVAFTEYFDALDERTKKNYQEYLQIKAKHRKEWKAILSGKEPRE